MSQPSYKVMILGAIGVGKTALCNRLAFDSFADHYKATIGVELYTMTLARENGESRLTLWDTDGEFGSTIFDTVYMRGASAALIVADVTRPLSIERMETLIEGFRDHCPGRPCAAIFNKSDLVAPSALAEFTLKGAEADVVAITSAMTGEGVNAALTALVDAIERRSL